MQTFFLERNEAEGFFELYKGIHPEYNPMIDQCISGPMIALEIRQENAVNSFKQICGIMDPIKGRTQNGEQTTIRAQFGIDRVQNAVHCTDLPDEGTLDCEYFFVLMEQMQKKR